MWHFTTLQESFSFKNSTTEDVNRPTSDNGALLDLVTRLWMFSICWSAKWTGGAQSGVSDEAGAAEEGKEEGGGAEQTPDIAISNSIPSGSTRTTNMLQEEVVLKREGGKHSRDRHKRLLQGTLRWYNFIPMWLLVLTPRNKIKSNQNYVKCKLLVKVIPTMGDKYQNIMYSLLHWTSM